MIFANNIKRICTERGTTLTAVIKKVKGSSAFVTAINRGSLPKENEMVELAKELNCSIVDFFDDNHIPKAIDEDEQDLLMIYRSFPRRVKHEFMAMAYKYEQRGMEESDVQ